MPESSALADAIDWFYAADVFLHIGNLARAVDVRPDLDPVQCKQMSGRMEPMEATLRSSGRVGPRVLVAGDADRRSRLASFIGRDRAWRSNR